MEDYNINDAKNTSWDYALNETITQEITSEVHTLSDIWTLAKITNDIVGDPVWELLFKMDCNPKPFANLGYTFIYKDLNCIYFTKKRNSKLIRFAVPKIRSDRNSGTAMIELVNKVNSLVKESKFAIMDDEVWLIYERFVSDNEDYPTLVLHILENLKIGVEIFHNLS